MKGENVSLHFGKGANFDVTYLVAYFTEYVFYQKIKIIRIVRYIIPG